MRRHVRKDHKGHVTTHKTVMYEVKRYQPRANATKETKDSPLEASQMECCS